MPRFQRFFFFTSIALAGCGGIGPYGATSEVRVNTPVKIQINSAYFVNDLKQSLYERMRDGIAIPFGEITQIWAKDQHINWAERHRNENFPSLTEAYKSIQSLASGHISDDMGEIKAEVELRIFSGRGVPVAYNAYAYSAFDMPFAGAVQSYSGTVMHFLILREAWGQAKFSAANTVAIFESGHVLPGYVVLKDGEWHLYGIETTVAGKGRVVYGPLKQAMKDRMLRVIDGELFTYVDLFKFEADNLVELTNEAMRITAEKYGIVDPAYLVAARFRRETDYGKLAWSPFGFGTADITLGNRVRSQYDEKSRTDLPRPNPNTTIFHKPAPTPEPAPAPGPKPIKTSDRIEPVYPYREIASEGALDGKTFQCWEYRRQIWVDLVHTKTSEKGIYEISNNPCALGMQKYEPLPAQLRLRVRVQAPPRYYGPSSDPDEEEDED